MAISTFVLAMAGITLVALGALVVGVRQTQSVRVTQRWRSLAGRLGGMMRGDLPLIRFSIHGRPALLQRDLPDSDERIRTAVRVNLQGISPGALKIFPDEYFGFYKRLIRMEDLGIGDAEFDRQFVVQATPTALAGEVFSEDRRARLMGSVRRLQRLGAPRIDLGAEQLEVGVGTAAGIDDLPDLLALVDVASEWTRLLVEMSPGASIHWISVDRAVGGLCRVCGTALADRVVECWKCRTPHHRECWEYAGRCSTFACGEVRSRSA